MPNESINVELLNRFAHELDRTASMVVLDQKKRLMFEDGERLSRLDAWLLMEMPNGDTYGETNGETVELAIDVLKTGYPRDVRAAIQQLLSFQKSKQGSSSRAVLCVVADYLSSGARDLLRDAGICYYDSAGAMYFKHRDYLIVKEPGQRIRQPRRVESFLTGAREQVVHALLIHDHRAASLDDAYISGAELANLAQTSTHTVSVTLQALEAADLIQSKGSGPSQRRRLSDAARLLDAWATEWVARREVMKGWYGFNPKMNAMAMVTSAFSGRDCWAVTGAAAANAVVSRLTSVERIQVIVPPGCSQSWGEKMNFEQVDKGANILMIEREGASLMFCEEDPARSGLRVASPFIQYLDLLDGYGRNKELAEVFRQQVLKM